MVTTCGFTEDYTIKIFFSLAKKDFNFFGLQENKVSIITY